MSGQRRSDENAENSGMVAQACNPSTRETEAGGPSVQDQSLTTQPVGAQPGLSRKTLSEER